MTLEKDGLAVPRQQLAVLGFVHFVADMMGNFLPAIMPAVREEFALTLTMGTGVLFAFYFVHNGLQVFIGHLRTEKDKPLFLPLGLCLCGMGAYVMMVTMARHANGLKIGQRMGLLVGGTWAVAGAAALGASTFLGAAMLLGLAPVCYAISVVIGLWIMSTNGRDKN